MYSLPQVYGDRPFDLQKYLPRCMYNTNPYYEVNTTNNNSESMESTTSILPLPLLPTDIDLKDVNIKNTLEELFSRQMLILCRLNQLEQQLLEQSKVNSNIFVASNSARNSGLVKSTLSLDVPQNLEDIVIHFSLNNVPFSLLTVISALRKHSVPVMVNLHVHSSVATQPRILARIGELRHRLQSVLGFSFTTSEQYLSRSQYQIIVTFIATSNTQQTNEPYAVLNGGKRVISGEWTLVREFIRLIAPAQDKLPGAQQLWTVLTNSKQLCQDKTVLENLGQLVFNLSDSQFLFGQSKPSLVDAALWSLNVREFARGVPVSATFNGSQLLNSKWHKSVHQFISTFI